MTQIQQLGFLANNLTVNTSTNTATITNTLVVGNSSVNVVINSSSVYVSGAALGSGGSANAAAQYSWTNTQTFSNTITFTGAILANTVNAASHTVGTAVTINSTSMAVNAFSIGSSNTATFYNINGQANIAAGAFVSNAYATLGGASGNYLAFGQQTSSAQWIQSGYSSAGSPVYYHILLNPLGGNIGIGNNAPSDRLSVNGTTYLQGNTTVTGNTTVVNVYSTGTINAAAVTVGTNWTSNSTGAYHTGTINAASYTVGTNFIANSSQLTVATPVSANGGVGTAGQVLTSNGATGSPYWATSSGGGGFTNGQSISVSNLAITGSLSASGSVGLSGQVLTSNGANVYWSSTTTAITALRQSITGDGANTVFTISGGYTPNAIDVFVNGLKFRNNSDVTVTSGSTITFAVAPPSGALIDVVGTVPTTYSSITPVSYSVGFNGSSQYLLAPANSALEFGSNNFTIEFWWYPTSTSRQALYHGSFGTDWSIGIDYNSVGTNKIGLWASSNGTNWNLINSDAAGNGIGTITPTQNSWNHVAFVRSGTTWSLYVNGQISVNITGLSGTIVSRSSSTKSIGMWFNNVYPLSGYLSNFRIVNGVAVYTAVFTPPTTPLSAVQLAVAPSIQAITGTQTSLLTCNAPTIIDGSTNAFTITNNGSAPVSTAIVPTFTNVTINSGSSTVNISDTFVSVFLLGL